MAVVAAGALAVFASMARHGLDLTDEGFYLLNFRYWNATPVFTLFGAYLQIPYRLLGESLWAMRMLGAILLVSSSAWCAWQLMLAQGGSAGASNPRPIAASAIAAGITAFNYYGGFIVPYTPSYNTLALICALTATALTIRVARALARGFDVPMLPALALGLVISVGVANKFSAGVLVALIDALIAAVILWRTAPWRRVGLALAWALAGFVLNAAILVAVDPDLPLRFKQGISIQLALLPRDLAGEYVRFISSQLPHGLFEALRMLLWPTALALSVLALGKMLGGPRWVTSVAAAGFLASAMFIGFARHRGLRIEFISLAAVLLWIFWAATSRAAGEPLARWRAHALAGAMLAMPFAYSFGTNNSMLEHMAMASVFPSLLIACALYRLRSERRLQEWAFVLSLGVLAVAPAEVFVRQWLNGEFTYRLGSPLKQQNTRLPANPAGVETLVDDRMAETTGAFLRITREAGLQPGTAVFDFTGQAPGLVMLAGGRPIGAAWIAGGGQFRGDDAATVAVSMVRASDLRRAWFLSSDDSFARISSWRRIVEAKLGSFPYEEVGRMTLPDPSSPDKTVSITLSVWRPLP